MELGTLQRFIHRCRGEILEEVSRQLQESSSGLATPSTMAQIATTLDDLSEELNRASSSGDLQAGGPPAKPKRSSSGTEQGRQRQRGGQDIDRLAHDYGALCNSLMQVAIRHNLHFAARDYQILNLTLDEAIAVAVQEFWSQSRTQESEQASERVGRVVHELRNALGSVTLSFGAIAKGRVGVQSKTAAVLARALTRANALAEEMLAAVKLKAIVAIDRKRHRVRKLVDDVRVIDADERGVRVQVEGDGLEVEGDEALLLSAIGNLVQNAVKFTHDRSTVTVRLREAAGRALIEVEDECGGLPAGSAEQLFQPFTQHGADRSGAGLGLSIARDAVRAHGGEIVARNLPRKGCVFTIDLPVAPPLSSNGH